MAALLALSHPHLLSRVGGEGPREPEPARRERSGHVPDAIREVARERERAS
jgi:hypothetical protein